MASKLPKIASLATVSLLGACAGPLNNEHGIGNAGRPFDHSLYTPASLADATTPPPPEGLEPTTNQQLAPVYGAAGPADARVAQPSLVSLDRSNWSSTSIEVPNDFTAHQPRLATNYINKESNPRAQGKYPNERTALGLGTARHNDEQAFEAVAAPFVAASDVVLMVPRAIAESRPRRPTRTGGEGYARMPSDVLIVNPSVEPNGPAARIRTLPPAPGEQIADPGAAPISGAPAKPVRRVPRVLQPPADDLRPGGGMPATDVAPAPPPPQAPPSQTSKP